MADPDLDRLTASAAEGNRNPLDEPPPAALDYLSSLDLSQTDLELLLGDTPGLSFADVKGNAAALFFRLRKVLADLVCTDNSLKDTVKKSITAGTEAAWIAIVAALGLTPGTIAAAALKPLASGLVVAGVERLCRTNSAGTNDGESPVQ
jgi:hypothetical protein